MRKIPVKPEVEGHFCVSWGKVGKIPQKTLSLQKINRPKICFDTKPRPYERESVPKGYFALI